MTAADNLSPTAPDASPRTRGWDAARIALLILLAWAVFLPETPLLRPVPPRDSGMFLYGGQLLNQGGALYLDFWDHKPPLIFVLNALGLWLGGGSMLGVYALQALTLAAAVLLSYALLKRAFAALPAAFATAAWVAALAFVINGNQIEEWALPLQFGLLYAFVLGEQRARGGWPLLLAGTLVGLLFFLRPNLIGLGVALGAFLLLRLILTRRRYHDDLRLLQFVLGGLAVALVMVAVFALSGTLSEMWFAAVTYNTLYAANAALSRFDALRYGLDLLLPSGLPVLGFVAWVAGIGALLTRRIDRLPPLLVVALLALPLELLLASLSARRYDHYYVAPLPSFALLAAWLGAVLLAGARTGDRAAAPALPAWLWAAALAVGVGLLPAVEVANRVQTAFPIPENSAIQRVVAFVRDDTQPGETVLVWGAQPLINFLAGRAEPSRYFFHSPLFMQGYASPQVFATFLDDLRANPPVLIIDTAITDRGFGPLDPQRRAEWLAQVSGRDPAVTAIPEIDVIYDYFARNYEKAGAFGFGWDVYRLTGSGQ
jgi:4-amino-4-deoxy-L-arabinose transferase-like glycosyltransferase